MSDSKKIRMQLQCPMPKLDFDVITLGHGSGGSLTNKLLDSGVFDLLSNDVLDKRHDGAFLELNGKMAFSTDSFLVSPIFFPGGNIGELAVNGTVNDIAMCGAIPKYLSLSFILEEGLKMTEFWEILVAIKQACEKANVKVVTGDTKVVEKGKGEFDYVGTRLDNSNIEKQEGRSFGEVQSEIGQLNKNEQLLASDFTDLHAES